MMHELRTIAALTDIKDLRTEEDSSDLYIQRLEQRLRAANAAVRRLSRSVERLLEVSDDDIRDLVNTLETTLAALPLNEAKAYALTFTPERLKSIERQSAASARAIRQVLRDFCGNNGVPLLYTAWGLE